jgi:hypothetical protein
MKRKAHGAQEPKHIQRYVEVTSTAQRSDSPAQAINQRFLYSKGTIFMLTLDNGIAYYLCGIMLVSGLITLVGVFLRREK